MRGVCALFVLATLWMPSAGLTATVYLRDYIDDDTRSRFNGFEAIESDSAYPAQYFSDLYSESGIVVRQINGDADTVVVCGFCISGSSRVWYPNGGDYGWTEIALEDGSEFHDLGLTVGHGFDVSLGPVYLFYDAYLKSDSRLSGRLEFGTARESYFGIGGGGFDLLRVRASYDASSTWGDFQAAALDDIEVRSVAAGVSEPSSMSLFCAALLLLGARRRFGKRRRNG